MKEKYDIVIIGAGISGCSAALVAAEKCDKIVILEAEPINRTRPFLELLLYRDIKNKSIGPLEQIQVIDGFVNVTGNKISMEIEYGEDDKCAFMKGEVLQEYLQNRLKEKKIEIRRPYKVNKILEYNGYYEIEESRTNDRVLARAVIVCAGLNGLNKMDLDYEMKWPDKIKKIQSKYAVVTKIEADKDIIRRRFKNKTYEYYTKNTFDMYIMYPFYGNVYLEAVLCDVLEKEAIDKIKTFMTNNEISKKLLYGINAKNLTYNTEKLERIGPINTTVYPSLIIAGDAMNIRSPVYLNSTSTYWAVVSGKAAAETICEHILGKIDKYEIKPNYENKCKDYLDLLSYEMNIIEESVDQYELFGKWINNIIENNGKYYRELKI